MDILNNYSNYKRHEKEYATWKNSIDQAEAKRLKYLQNNPLSEQEKTEAMQRGKVLLNAIDVMDEYSQTKAEDVEIATEIVSKQLQNYIYFGVFSILGFAFAKFGKLNILLNKFFKGHIVEMLPVISGIITGFISIPIVSTATNAQIGASKQGRFEAMRKELENPALFSVLTDSQNDELNKKVKNITLSETELQKVNKQNINANPFNFVSTINGLIREKDIYKKQRENFENEVNENNKHIANTILSDEEVLNAKKDKQLLTKLVNKIDIASQDYAENLEMITNIIGVTLTATGLSTGLLLNKIMKLCKIDRFKYGILARSSIAFLITFLPEIIFASYFTELQKQGSRVGRFKVKQDLLKDANNFAYVDDDKIKNMPDIEMKKEKKQGIFDFIKQAWQDNKRYKEYLKTQSLENKKLNKAKEEMLLSNEQLSRGKTLQNNTFKVFNKVDDMSQKYSESVEAAGEIVQNTFGNLVRITAITLGMAFGYKKILNTKSNLPDSILKIDYFKFLIAPFIGILGAIIPTSLLEIYVTKEQKKASRVADMMAIKEMDDYKLFANYQQHSKNKQLEIINNFWKKVNHDKMFLAEV